MDQLKVEAAQVYKTLNELCNRVSDSPSPDLNFIDLKKLKYLSKEADIPVLDFLLKRESICQINSAGKASYTISEDDFINLFSGEKLQEVLYQNQLEEQRFYVEDLTQLYTILGGDEDGISRDKLKSNIEKYINDNNLQLDASEECKEVLDLLASNNDTITLEDFVNMMTCQTPLADN